MNTLLEIRLPDDVLEGLPAEREQMVTHLSKYLDEVVRQYEIDLTKNVSGFMGQPLSRYEKATIKDFLIRMVVGQRLFQQFEHLDTQEEQLLDIAK